MALTLIKIYSPVQLYISAIASGLNVIFFWIPYNSMHFKFSRDSKRGLNSGIYFMITPILGVTLQPLAGVIGEKFGFATVFAIGVLLYLIPLFLLRTLPDFKWNTDVRKEFFAKKFNWSIFMQGFVWRINASLVPIFTLFFIKTPREFGNFFGYLAIAAAVASLLNAYFSDKLKSRKHFFYIFSAIAVLSFLPLAFAQNAYYWGIFAGVASLCLYLANPFWLAYNLDEYKDIPVEKTMVLREIFLNLGYVTALIVAMLLFYTTGSFKIALAITCLFALLMPILSYFQGVYRNK